MPMPRFRHAALPGPLLLAWALLWAPPAAAHSLLLTCKPAADNAVRCVGGFSDGSDAAGMGIQVKAYDERVLAKGTLGGDSAWVFPRPAGEFFVRLDDGGEHAAEVDHADVKP